ncbi:hypothetical protein V3C99_014607, partial [Haemonchus contortus]
VVSRKGNQDVERTGISAQ